MPRDEALLFDAACALKERHMLLQGRLYVFQARVASRGMASLLTAAC